MKFIFRRFAKLISKWNFYIIKSLAYDTKNRQQIAINLDYIRHKTLELCCHEIKLKNITGNIAELGVYKGDFAIKINELFQDKKLYLFDTFSGFDYRDIEKEKVRFSDAKQDFSKTNVEYVHKRMKYPEQCIFKKGYFPETAIDINDKFSFVSIDADLYEPILNGLNFFYPRLEKNGYIFVHDFNNKEYKGAREAVLEFCNTNNIGFVPIPDIGGSVVITK
jgi:O-methyltransferase